jgi:hypothetical protein
LWRNPMMMGIQENKPMACPPHQRNQDNITDTVLCDQCPTEFLPDRPPPSKAIHNVYKLQTQPKLVWYYHTVMGFPTKPPWLKTIKNKQYTSWLGLTWDAANKHYLESKKTLKGHGCKTQSGLR